MMETREELKRLLEEDVSSVHVRERAMAELLASADAPPLVLFGAGNLGRKTAAELTRLGVRCTAFSDNAERLWNSEVQGLPVLAPEEAARRFGARGIFVVTIWHPFDSHRFSDTQRQLRALGCVGVLPFAPLFWSYAERLLPYMAADLPAHVVEARDEVLQAGTIWADSASRREYLAQIRWRLLGDLGGLPDPVEHEQYFALDLFQMRDTEVIADCGAFDGDTIKCLVERLRLPFKQLHAFEPDPTSFAALKNYVKTLPMPVRGRIVLHQVAVASRSGPAYFAGDGTMSAMLSDDGRVVVQCARLDDLLADSPPAFIKMDIEGAEADALRGAECLIRKYRPIMAVSAYHRQSDVWEIPLLLRSLCEEYSFFLRPHQLEGFELVCYAVPQERLLISGARGTSCG